MDKILELILTNAAIPAIIFVLGWLAGRYIKPWVHDKEHPDRLARAQEIAFIASRLTEELKTQFPNASWDDWVDNLSDKLIDSLGLTPEVARREALYQLAESKKIGAVLDSRIAETVKTKPPGTIAYKT